MARSFKAGPLRYIPPARPQLTQLRNKNTTSNGIRLMMNLFVVGTNRNQPPSSIVWGRRCLMNTGQQRFRSDQDISEYLMNTLFIFSDLRTDTQHLRIPGNNCETILTYTRVNHTTIKWNKKRKIGQNIIPLEILLWRLMFHFNGPTQRRHGPRFNQNCKVQLPWHYILI